MDESLAGIRRTTEVQVAVQQALGRRPFCEIGGDGNAITLARGTVSHPLTQVESPSARTSVWRVGFSPCLEGRS